MTDIPELVEGANVVIPDYAEQQFSEDDIETGAHRRFVSGKGGEWDRDGLRQLTFLKEHGLRPDHRFIDIGCGALRAGRHLIDYLDAGNYYGVDANRSLLQIGYDRELTDEQRAKLPITNLRANDRFNVDFGVEFDMAIAQSVFTHVSLNHMRLCLYRLGKVMSPGGVFYASFVEQPGRVPIDYTYEAKGGRTFLNEKNVFWYHRADMSWAATFGPWKFRYVGGLRQSAATEDGGLYPAHPGRDHGPRAGRGAAPGTDPRGAGDSRVDRIQAIRVRGAAAGRTGAHAAVTARGMSVRIGRFAA